MQALAVVALVGWVPVSVGCFALLPTRRAVVASAVIGWLFLPVAGLPLPGLPDLTKSSAPTAGLLIGVLAFDPGRLLRLRPRWCDLPIAAWCAAPFLASVTNDLGAYDGFSGLLNHAITWGLPYLVGRTCLGDAEGRRELAAGVVAGGLAYVPFCLLEVRISPQLHRIVYGFAPGAFGQTIRYGGYRPQVFMAHGLELGMWMTAASLAGWYLWSTGVLKRPRGVPFGGLLLPALLATTVLCKSTGSLLLLAGGAAVLWVTRRARTRAAVVGLALVAPLYAGTRIAGGWDGRETVEFFNNLVGSDRGESLAFRLKNEDLLVAKAMQRPAFGWGGWGRARVYNDEGRDLTVTDGLWIIALGNYGLFGLSALTATTLTPLALLAAKQAPAAWGRAEVAPAAVLAVLLGLLTVDNLSNAMFNPIFLLAAGSLSALAVDRTSVAEPTLTPASPAPAAPAVRARRGPAGPFRPAGAGRETLAAARAVAPGAARDWRAALNGLRHEAGDGRLDPSARRALAGGLERQGRWLARRGLTRRALRAREEAVGFRAGLVAEFPDDAESAARLAEDLNDCAWLLAVGPDPADRDPARAAEMAAEAVRLAPGRAAFWNTLGAAHLRAGDAPSAVAALEQAVDLGGGGTCADYLLLALAHAGRGDLREARRWYGPAAEGLGAGPAGDPVLEALRAEAERVVVVGGES